jgi:ferritin-like protein
VRPAREEESVASEGLHEPLHALDEATIDHHRAVKSLCEELEAVDWYDQRVKATNDSSLAAVLAHNRDEEKEHASMTLEWVRRRDPALDRHLRTYLFTTEPITEIEAEVVDSGPGAAAGAASGGAGSLGIGSLRGSEQ